MKTYVGGTVIMILFLAGSFYGGMKYGEGKGIAFRGGTARMDTEGRFRGAAGGAGFRIMRGGGGVGGGFAGGEIIFKDDNSITVKTQDGGSKIIFFSSGTEVTKFVSGTLDDLTAGIRVMIQGEVNPDGSITAKSVQVVSTE